MQSTEETTEAPASTETPENPVAAAPVDDPETVRALARETFAWCSENASDPESLPRLNTVLQLVHDTTLARDALSASQAVVAQVLTDESPGPATHAHMTVLLSLLLDYERISAKVDELFAAWMRHPRSFGVAHATPPELQREAFILRLGDMLGWETIDLKRDRDALTRFAFWVDTWTPKNKLRARRALDAVRRNFPAPDVWGKIYFPQGGPPAGQRHKHPRGSDRRPSPQGAQSEPGPEVSLEADSETSAEAPDAGASDDVTE